MPADRCSHEKGGDVAGITTARAGDHVGTYRRRGRRYATYSREIGAGLVANVVDGWLMGFGLEPTTAVLVRRDGHVEVGDRRLAVLVWAAPLAGAAAGAVATRAVLRHRRVA